MRPQSESRPSTPVSVSVEANDSETESIDQSIALVEARLHILQLRDFAIGEAARVGEMKSRLNTKENELDEALRVNYEKNIHIQNHEAHIARLEEAATANQARIQPILARSDELTRVYASQTWKLGRLILLPIRAMKRLLRTT